MYVSIKHTSGNETGLDKLPRLSISDPQILNFHNLVVVCGYSMFLKNPTNLSLKTFLIKKFGCTNLEFTNTNVKVTWEVKQIT